jgi:hypothetical protein
MNLEPAPRQKKAPIIIVVSVCLIAILLIGLFAPNKFAPLPFLSAVGFLIISITAIMFPVIIDYAADSAEYVQQERLRVNEQIQRLQAAGESLARAASQIKAVEEAVHKAAHSAENLPYRMQEKLAEFNESLAEKESSDHEALEQELVELRAAQSDQLKAVADKIAKTTAELAALEVAARRQLSAAEAAAAKVPAAALAAADQLETKLNQALAALDAKLAALARAAAQPAPPPAVAAVYDRREEPAPTTDGGHRPPLQEPTPEPAPVISDTSAAPADEEAKPKKPRAPRKPKAEDTLLAMSEPPATDTPAEIPVITPLASDSLSSPPEPEPAPTASSSDEPTEAAASSDGATRLLATAYIGIGNKLYIRGDGPGLSWDKGVAMQFVSIGKWGWATHDATAPVRCALYKNDAEAALTGEVTLAPGKHVEVTALF